MKFKYRSFNFKYIVIGLIIPILTIALSSCELSDNDSINENIIREITSEDQINEAYQKAKAAYLWFYYEPLSYESYVKVKSGDSSSEELGPKLVDGLNYYKATSDKINTYNQLKNYLNTIFSEEIVNDMLNGENVKIKYKDIDKALYGTVPEIRPPSQTQDESYKVQKINPYRYIYNLNIDILTQDRKNVDHRENYEYVYEFVNDRWVFTKFHLFY